YSSGGTVLWTNFFGQYAYGKSVALGANGNIYVAGYYYNQVWETRCAYSGGTGYDFATIAYSSDGIPLWTNFYNGPANSSDTLESGQALAVGGDGSLYVTGRSTGGSYSGYAFEYAMVKY